MHLRRSAQDVMCRGGEALRRRRSAVTAEAEHRKTKKSIKTTVHAEPPLLTSRPLSRASNTTHAPGAPLARHIYADRPRDDAKHNVGAQHPSASRRQRPSRYPCIGVPKVHLPHIARARQAVGNEPTGGGAALAARQLHAPPSGSSTTPFASSRAPRPSRRHA